MPKETKYPSEFFCKKAIVPLYGPPLTLVLAVTDNLKSYYYTICPDGDNPPAPEETGFSLLLWPFCYLIIDLTHGLHWNLLFHEVDHCAHTILQAIGMKPTEESEEAYTHLNGWIGAWVCKKLGVPEFKY